MITYSNKLKGIALIQVLLLSAIITIFLLSVTVRVRQHIKLAEQVKARTAAVLRLHDLEVETLYLLLTEPKMQSSEAKMLLASNWNFYGAPVQLDNDTTVNILDLSALVPLNHQGLLRHLIVQSGTTPSIADKIVKEIQDSNLPGSSITPYQHQFIMGVNIPKVRNTATQHIDDLRFLPSMTPEIYKYIKPYITNFPLDGIYPLGMHKNVLSFFVAEPALTQILDLRQLNLLNPQKFELITGMTQGENVHYSPGNELRLCFTVRFDQGELSRRIDVSLFPYAQQPFVIWDYQKNYHEKNVSNECVY